MHSQKYAAALVVALLRRTILHRTPAVVSNLTTVVCMCAWYCPPTNS
uniref:Uncharacterized protein n=1 Tax=Arundo donax TaxID=35708 RepID=A0A0A9DRK8_ARUDO